jgi:hypothetical protein
MQELRTQWPVVTYRVPGRRGPVPLVIYDPDRVDDPVAALGHRGCRSRVTSPRCPRPSGLRNGTPTASPSGSMNSPPSPTRPRYRPR